jgi:phosphatidate cytidylyltransferase
MSAFYTRLISATFMIAGMAVLFYFGKKALLLFTLITMLGIQCETYNLLFSRKKDSRRILRLFILGLSTVMGPYIGFSNSMLFSILSLISIELFVTPLIVKPSSVMDSNAFFQTLANLIILSFYGLFLPSQTYLILSLEHGIFWFLLLLFTTLGSDTCAYLVGKRFGKRPLSPVSPNKTLEGSIGGALGAMLITLPFSFQRPDISTWSFLLTGLMSGLLGQVGDLFESLLKRRAEVKDSGYLIPGHGGLLDRIDGIIFASPWIYWVGLWLS